MLTPSFISKELLGSVELTTTDLEKEILNLGLNDVAVEGFAKKTNNPRFAYDSYRRFIQMYSDVVCEVDKELFEAKLTELKNSKGESYKRSTTFNFNNATTYTFD